MDNWNEKTNGRDIADFAKTNKLFGITFPVELFNDTYAYDLISGNTRVFTHTVNDKALSEKYINKGILIYTDGF